MKKTIRLTEGDLHRIIKESLNNVIEKRINEGMGVDDNLCKYEGFKQTYISREIRKIWHILENLRSDREGVVFTMKLHEYLNEIEYVIDNITSVMDGNTTGSIGDSYYDKPEHYNDAFKRWQKEGHL